MSESLVVSKMYVGGSSGGTLAQPPAWAERAEIDTSTPFESVREAVDHFGGSAIWKTPPLEKHHFTEEIDVISIEEETAQLEKDLIAKERETLDVLKELEMTKRFVDGLKLKIQKEESDDSEIIRMTELISDSAKVHPLVEKKDNTLCGIENDADGSPSSAGKQSPGVILKELKQAKLNLNRTTSDLAGIRVCIDQFNKKIAKEKMLLEKTHEKLSSNTAKVSSLEEQLSKTTIRLQEMKKMEAIHNADPTDISRWIKELSSEIENYKNRAEIAKSEILKLTDEIEQSKCSIKTAEIRCIAAKKMEEAARASEAVALAEIKSRTDSKTSTLDVEGHCKVILPIEEYVMLTRKAQEAEEISRKKIESAMTEVDEANRSNEELVIRVEEATAEVKTSRKALEEALDRVDAANRDKLSVEEALRRWSSEHGQKRRLVHNSTKFKNSPYPVHHRRDSRILDLNGTSAVTDASRSALKPLSIGQILSMKLMSPEKYETEVHEKTRQKPKVSLRQMLTKKNSSSSPKTAEDGSSRKQSSAKRKKFGLVSLSVLLVRQEKNKKKKRRQSLK